ncbi:MAG: helix-turn-helix transcriptional regulator [Clostridia bacterium]|nr:helix-turn-helix transcriptional regulator [Clostridia bacterium]
MNCLSFSNIKFQYAGLFQSTSPWIHPDRTENTYEIIYVSRGEVHLREGDQNYRLVPGELLLLSPGVRHYGTKHTQGVRFYWLHFHILSGELPFEKRYFEHFDAPYLFKELLHYSNLPDAPRELIDSILLHALADLFRLSREQDASGNERAEKIYEWIRINASAKLKVSDVAKAFGYTNDHLSRICKKHWGAGARVLIDRILLARAKSILCNSDRYVKEIAAQLSFSSDKSFLEFFRYHEGISPTEFRNRFSKIHMNNK